MWQHWVNLVLGIWVAIVPYFGFDTGMMQWILAVSGIAIAIVAVWGALGKNLMA